MKHVGYAVVAFLAAGCASLMGLDELTELPDEFPLSLQGEFGHITTLSDGSQVSVDAVYPSEKAAREGWKALESQAESGGFQVSGTSRRDKLDRTVLDGAAGKLELGCCRQRADRQWLVYISWFKP